MGDIVMKILLLSRSLDRGGAERQLVALAVELHARGVPVEVAVFYVGGLLRPLLDNAGVRVHDLRKRSRWDVIGFLWRFRTLLKRERPDVLYSFLGMPNIIAVGLRCVLPRMKVIWGVRASNIDLSHYDWLSRVAYRIERALSRWADLIVANSEAGLAYATANGFPRAKMRVIANGIDTSVFRPASGSERQQVRSAWGVNDQDVVVGLVGRLDPAKDIPSFLHAASIAFSLAPFLKFVIVGDGPKTEARVLKDLSNRLRLSGCLTWMSARHDIQAVYIAFDILVSSSVSEGFSNVIGEAMACGVPCVVTDVGDSAAIVGSAGVVVPPGRPDLLARGIVGLARNPTERRALAPRLVQRVDTHYSLRKMVDRTCAVLNEVRAA